MDKIREKCLELIALDLACNDMGIYPQVTVSNGVETKRTEKQEGWNEYGMTLTKKQIAIQKWLEEIPPEHKTNIENLLLDGTLFLSTDGERIAMLTDSSDLFAWGYSDADEVKFDDLPAFNQALQDSPKFGSILWICRREKLRPQKPYYKYFSEEDKKLFDACGDKYGWAS